MAIYDYSPTKVELQSLIQFFSGGRCNVTLGGGPSIQVRYGGLWKIWVDRLGKTAKTKGQTQFSLPECADFVNKMVK